MTTCAEAVADELVRLGVRYFFLLTGGDHALWVAFKRAGVSQILARSENAAVYMADGYARVTQAPGFVYGQYGPGAANVVAGLAEPWWSSSPVVVLASAMRRQHRYRFEYQELDQPLLFAAVTKWQAEASIPEQVPYLIRAGVLRALAGNPGPVYIGVPNDLPGISLNVQSAGLSAQKIAQPLRFPIHRPRAPSHIVTDAARLLADARRPIILVGNGVHASGAYKELVGLAERLNVPVITSLSGKGAIAEHHRLAVGVAGRYSRNYANRCLKSADLVLAIGSRLGGLVTDSYTLIPPDCRFIHVDIDPVAIGHNFPTEVGVHADARAWLEDLPSALESVDLEKHRAERDQWCTQVASEKEAWWRRFLERAKRDASPIAPEALLKVLQEVISPDALVLADTGYAAAWVGALYEVRAPGRGFIRSDGSLGWALPAALGAKLAAPDRPVVAVTGDGGFGYHVGELETAVRLQLPIVVVILNNRSLAFEYHIQELLYGQPVTEVDDFVDVDYAAVARAFGAAGFRVDTVSAFRNALIQAMSSNRPAVVDALIDKEAIAPVTRYDAVRQREL